MSKKKLAPSFILEICFNSAGQACSRLRQDASHYFCAKGRIIELARTTELVMPNHGAVSCLGRRFGAVAKSEVIWPMDTDDGCKNEL